MTKATPKKLSYQERLFVLEYLQDTNAVQAAIRAGYAESTAHKKAHLWVGKSRRNSIKPHVWDAVQEAMAKRAEKLRVSSDQVVAHLASVALISLDDERVLSGQVKVSDKLKALELLGKHLGMFKDVLEVDIPSLDKVLERLEASGSARHLSVVSGAS